MTTDLVLHRHAASATGTALERIMGPRPSINTLSHSYAKLLFHNKALASGTKLSGCASLTDDVDLRVEVAFVQFDVPTLRPLGLEWCVFMSSDYHHSLYNFRSAAVRAWGRFSSLWSSGLSTPRRIDRAIWSSFQSIVYVFVTFAMGTAAEHVTMLLSSDHRLLIQFELYVFTPASAV